MVFDTTLERLYKNHAWVEYFADETRTNNCSIYRSGLGIEIGGPLRRRAANRTYSNEASVEFMAYPAPSRFSLPALDWSKSRISRRSSLRASSVQSNRVAIYAHREHTGSSKENAVEEPSIRPLTEYVATTLDTSVSSAIHDLRPI